MELTTTEISTSSFMLLRLRYPGINRLLYSWLKRICSHDGILISIPIACLITPLEWQYPAFRVDIKDRFKMFEYPGTIFRIGHVSFNILLDFFFNSHK